jgi:hypothetical protein
MSDEATVQELLANFEYDLAPRLAAALKAIFHTESSTEVLLTPITSFVLNDYFALIGLLCGFTNAAAGIAFSFLWHF